MTAPVGIERVREVSPALFSLMRRGTVYDLSSGWWPGMPLAEGHPPFQVLTYRTPQGERLEDDLAFLEGNEVGFGFISELISMTAHTGTHIDALCHVVAGADPAWHGGHRVADWLGDFGPRDGDVAGLAPIISRGVLFDIPRALGQDRLNPHQPVGARDLAAAAERQRVEVRPGDVVLVRTGTMGVWPDREQLARVEGAGLSLEGARWILDRNAAVIGADTAAVEVAPSGIDGDPQPVHRVAILECGIPLLEWVYLESLAEDGLSEFLFLCFPLPIRGGTGSPVRPIAIA